MRVEIIAIGSELLDGTCRDVNVPTIGGRLSALGATVTRASVVPDDAASIADAIERAMRCADIVITTGGLGATADDRTKQVVARMLDRKLVLDEDVLARVRAHFAERGSPMPDVNLSQAMIPEGARPIENRLGTAPGIELERGGVVLCVLPGVPSEASDMMENYVVPFLEGRGLTRLTAERRLRTTGVPESELAERIEDATKKLARTEVRWLPSITGVDLSIVARGATRDEAERTAERAAENLADRLGSVVYARGDEEIEAVVGYLLTMATRTLAVAESCTGGLLGSRITSVPGSSGYFKGGVIAYSDELKKKLLGVKAASLKAHGAVSAVVAEEMADGVRERARSDYGVAITGVAGPGGGSAAKPVGLVYACVSCEGKRSTRELRFGGPRDSVRKEAAQAALDMLRRVLLSLEV